MYKNRYGIWCEKWTEAADVRNIEIHRVILFTCFSKDKDIEDDTQSFNLSRWGDYRVINIKRKTIGFWKIKFGVLSIFRLRNLHENHDLISSKQSFQKLLSNSKTVPITQNTLLFIWLLHNTHANVLIWTIKKCVLAPAAVGKTSHAKQATYRAVSGCRSLCATVLADLFREPRQMLSQGDKGPAAFEARWQDAPLHGVITTRSGTKCESDW